MKYRVKGGLKSSLGWSGIEFRVRNFACMFTSNTKHYDVDVELINTNTKPIINIILLNLFLKSSFILFIFFQRNSSKIDFSAIIFMDGVTIMIFNETL